MSFSVQKDNSGRIVKKNLNSGTSQTVTSNSSLASSSSIFSTNATSLTLNNVTVTASADELNKVSNITPGIATSNKPLVLDSSKNISNINTITCSNIIINGSQLGGNSGQSNQILNNITPGTVANSKVVVLDSSRNITNLNSISTNKLSISDANLNIEKDYEGFCNTFTSSSLVNSNNWISSCWADSLNLFVAISNTGINNRVMTSPDGITWTIQTSPADNNWTSICWSKQLTLLVVVASSGTGNRVMTSPNGIIWTLQTTPIDNNWSSICWAPELSLFIAVANSGTTDKVMTSPNGINWTIQTTSISNMSIGSIVSTSNNTFIVMNDGTIKGCGANISSQLLDGTTSRRDSVITLSRITNAIDVTAGNSFGIVLLSNGLLKSWGDNSEGQLGINSITSQTVPNFVRTSTSDSSPLKNVVMIDSGNNYCAALLTDGTIKTWGRNTNGQLGDATTGQRNSPVFVLNISNAIAISAGQNHCLALLQNGTIKSWGYNISGELGDNTTTQRNTPVSTLDITNAIAISAGSGYSIALLSDGTIRAWGNNTYGQLGDNTTNQRNTPVTVRTSATDATPLSGVIQIVASEFTTYALLSNGTIKAWGRNHVGQIGDNSIIQKNSPVTVSDITTAVTLSISKSNSIVALLADGTLKSWGTNASGQLGDNTINQRNIPVSVRTSSVDANPLTGIKIITNPNWNAVTWSRNLNLLVAVGNANNLNTVMTSSDGINWINRIGAGYSNWKSVCWAAEIGMYIAIANTGVTRIMTSSNGINWIPRTSNINNDWTHIIWSNEFQIAMAICNNYSNSKILISSDGINWMSSNTNNRKKLTSICWSNTLKKFCLLSNNDDSYKYLDNWVVSAAPINVTNEFRHVTWISQLNLFIAVGGSGSKILTSPDGITWTSRTSPNAGLFNNCVAYSPTLNLLVLVGDGRSSNPYILTSPNGITWTSRTGPAAVNWANITWGNGLFVAIAQNTGNAATSIMTSPDGINWTLRTAPASAEWFQIIWVNELSLFVCVGSGTSSSGRIMTSPDGITWTSRNSPEENNWKGVAWSPTLQLLVAVADNPANNINPIMTSSDGINWISYPAPITYLWSILWSSELNMFVAINKDTRSNTTGSYMYSSNGTNWVIGLTNINQQFWSISWSSSLNTFIAVSGALNNENIIRSISSSNDTNIYSFLTNYSNTKLNLSKIIKNIYPNKSVVKYGLKEWYPISTTVENNWNNIIWAKNNFIIAGQNDSSNSKILYSSNGITWTGPTIPLQFRGNSSVYSQELDITICVGSTTNISQSANIFSSTNEGVGWIGRLYNTNNWKSICWSPDLMMFVTVSDSGNFNRVAISYDGINWNLQETNNNNWNSVCWSSELQLFVAVASSGTNRVMTSSNGINWIAYSAASNLDWTSVCWSPELVLFVAVASSGTGNRIMTSSNGINWTTRYSPENNNWNYVIWVPELRVFTAIASSGENRLMYSFNGIDWKAIALAINNSWTSICWSPNYGQFIMVSNTGTGNRIYRSRIITLTPSNSLLSSSPNLVTNNLLTNNGLLSFNLGSNPTTHQLEYHNSGLTFAVPYTPFYYNMNLRTDTIGFDMNTSNFSINISDHNGSTGGLALNGTLITASANNINLLNNITFGLATSSKILSLDSNRSITNINNLSCNSLNIISLFTNFQEGISSSNNLLITNSNKEINNINSLASKIVKIKNTSLTGYDNQLISNIQYATTFMRSTSIANIASISNAVWAPELGIFVAITSGTFNNYRTAVSSDGYNWTAYNHSNISDNQYVFTSIAWSPKLSLFVISVDSTSQSSPNFYTTTNGMSLNIVTVPYISNWISVAWSPELEMFAAISRSGTSGTSIITSTNGITWTTRTAPDTTWNDIRAMKGYFIAMSSTTYLLSSNGITWTQVVLPITNSMSWSRITYSPTLDLFVAVGASGTISRIITSSDLTNWTTRSTPVLNSWSNVLWLNDLNIFLAISSSAGSGTDNRIMFSSDGINWFIKSNSNYTFNFSNIIWSPSLSRMILLYSSTTILVSNSSLSSKLTEYKNNQYKLNLNKLVERNTKSIGTKVNMINNWNSRPTAINTSTLILSLSSSSIALQYESGLAILSDGTIKSWGNNYGGQLGDGTINQSNTPTNVSGITTANKIITQEGSSMTLLSNGTIMAWGHNTFGKLGDGTNTERLTPITISGITNAVDISLGQNFACIVLSNGTIRSWGHNLYGQLGNGTNTNSLSHVTVSGISNAIAVSSGSNHSIALLSNNTYVVWGTNGYGQLGDGTNVAQNIPFTPSIRNYTNVIRINANFETTGVVLSDGTIRVWGSLSTSSSITSITNVIDLALGFEHGLVLLSNGTIKSWGKNNHGQLGDNTTNNSLSTAIDVIGISNAIGIAAGMYSSMALLSNGTIKMWGRNQSGQLGINSIITQNLPVSVYTSSTDTTPLSNVKLLTTSQISYLKSTWNNIVRAPELNLFVAVSSSGTGNRIMTSPDAITWTRRISSEDNNWTSICWASELTLLVVVASSGTGNRIMTSPNGITWTTQTSPSDNNWTSVVWCKELTLFVAVASSGTGDRVMTSPDGITWTSRTSAADNNWTSVCWSPELSLLVAVSNTGTGNRVMTSPDGITWTSRTSAANNNWTSVCWCNNINTFIAVSNSNDSYRRVMTSEDGINWILRYSNNNNNWKQVIWINELNMAVAIADSGNKRIMTSFNGIDWQLRNLSITNNWTSMAWASDLGILCAISNSDIVNQIATTIMTYPTYKTSLIAYPNQLTINNATKRVGLGTSSPSYQLQLSTDSAYKLSTSTWTVSSDIRLKKNIQDADLDECYNKIKSLPLKRYKWKDDIYNSEEVNDRTKVGWIADDVQQVFPNSVNEIEAFGYNDCKSMNTDQIIAALYGCIKKLTSISENKKNTIIELQNKINNYKNIINGLEIVEE